MSTITPRAAKAARDTAIVDAYRGGLSLAQVGALFGINWRTVCKVLIRRGEPRRPPTQPRPQELTQAIAAAYRAGASVRKVGQQFGLSDAAVMRALVSANEPRRSMKAAAANRPRPAPKPRPEKSARPAKAQPAPKAAPAPTPQAAPKEPAPRFADIPASNPRGVRPIVCPSGEDRRYTVRTVTEPLFSTLGAGRYLKRDTAIARAYGGQA